MSRDVLRAWVRVPWQALSQVVRSRKSLGASLSPQMRGTLHAEQNTHFPLGTIPPATIDVA